MNDVAGAIFGQSKDRTQAMNSSAARKMGRLNKAVIVGVGLVERGLKLDSAVIG
jgi:hypothetical protein